MMSAGTERNAICDVMRATGILMHRRLENETELRDGNLCRSFSDEAIF
jgi:hypothetical protein